MKFLAQVVLLDDGFVWVRGVDVRRWQSQMIPRVGQVVQVDVVPRDTWASTATFRYWRGVVVEFFREVWNQELHRQGAPQLSTDEAHDRAVREFGPGGADGLRPSTRDMSQADFSHMIEAAKSAAWHRYRSRLPEPGEADEESEDP